MTGSASERLLALARRWPGWLLVFGPLGGFAVLYVVKGYGQSTVGSLPATAVIHLVWLQWAYALWPSVVGGPWHWVSSLGSYSDFPAPSVAAVVLGQLVVGALLIASWRRGRWQSLAAWSLPIVVVVAGVILVGLGRYAAFGTSAAIDDHYVFDVAVPVALAIALALDAGPDVPSSSHRADVRRSSRLGRRAATATAFVRRVPAARLLSIVVVVLLASSAVSDIRWTNRWARSPAKAYVTTLVTSVRSEGPSVSLYDTPVPLPIITFLDTSRSISDVLADAGVRGSYDGNLATLQVADDSGHVLPAQFFALGLGRVAATSGCPTLLHGRTSVTVPIDRQLAKGYDFLDLGYYQQIPSTIDVAVRANDGGQLAAPGEHVQRLGQSLGETIVKLGFGAPASVTLTTSDPTTNVCIDKIAVGIPLQKP